LTLTLNVSFGGSFSGNRVFYLAARDVNEANNTGLAEHGLVDGAIKTTRVKSLNSLPAARARAIPSQSSEFL